MSGDTTAVDARARYRARLDEAGQPDLGLVGPALLLGLAVGTLAAAFRVSLDYAIEARAWVVDSCTALGVPGWSVSIAIAVLGVGFAVWLAQRFAPEAAGSGIQEVEGALDGVRPMRWRRVIPVKFLGGMSAIGTGMIAGREGPTVQMGAALGQWVSDVLQRRSPIDAHVLIAAGAGAGLTAAFNVPFAGILFVVEEMRPQFRYGVVSMQALIGACVVSDVVVRALLGTTPEIHMNVHPAPPLAALWLFVLLGCGFGVLGPLFNTAVGRLLDVFGRLPSPYIAAAGVGGLVGWLAWAEPLVIGEGYHVIGHALRGELAVGVLLVLFGARYVGTILCFCAGSPGGVFAPMLALGTLLGMWFGEQAAEWLPLLVPHPDVFAVAGMGALFAAVVRAPLTGIALAVGLTSNYGLTLPVLATCLSAAIVSHKLGGQPLYAILLERTLRQNPPEPARAGAGSGGTP